MDHTARSLSSRRLYNSAPPAGESLRRYRCLYTPRDTLGNLNPSDTGAAPFVQLHAANAEQALGLAQHVPGCPVNLVERIEG